jgi:hypothetical protein
MSSDSRASVSASSSTRVCGGSACSDPAVLAEQTGRRESRDPSCLRRAEKSRLRMSSCPCGRPQQEQRDGRTRADAARFTCVVKGRPACARAGG